MNTVKIIERQQVTYGIIITDELSDDTNVSINDLNKKVTESKIFKYKTSITGSTDADGNEILPMIQISLAQKKLKFLFH